ncbi:receptor-transporting protein 3-like isoform X2 [Pogoniulus pusillus]
MKTWQNTFAEIAAKCLKEPWTLQEDDNLQVHDLKPGWKEFVQSHTLGRFQCSQCFREWSSAKVHILFHMCLRKGRGKVRMRIFRQACRRCPHAPLEEPDFSQETVEKVLHNLVLQILNCFYRVTVQASDFLNVVVDVPVSGPHDSTRCEGCQLGICSKSRLAPASDDWEPLGDVGKARTHCTLKRRPHATPPQPPSLFNCHFAWKRCCCLGIPLLLALGMLLFILFYFTMK